MEKFNEVDLRLIGNNIRKRRMEKGMSQQVLADHANLAKTTIQRIELARMNPSIQSLQSICTALGVEVSDLLKKS